MPVGRVDVAADYWRAEVRSVVGDLDPHAAVGLRDHHGDGTAMAARTAVHDRIRDEFRGQQDGIVAARV